MGTRLAWPIALFLLLALSPRVGAQGVARSFEQLQLLVRVGDAISVRESNGAETAGKIDRLSSSSLTLVTSGRQREFRETDVNTIRQRRGDSLANGALWGLASGVAAGGVFAAVFCGDCSGGVLAVNALFVGGVGAGIGVGVDALITRRVVIFERPSGAAALGVIPLLGQRRRGVALSVTF